jgi:riboflavin biosynthesis pyrimidine reductase
MKPYLICHMASSLDGRIIPNRWRPKGAHSSGAYDRIHDEIGCDAWLVGRVTGQEFAKRDGYAATTTSEVFPRASWIAKRGAPAYAVVLDGAGKIAWGRSDIGGDPIVVVLTEQVSDAQLAALRSDGVSYIFAGTTELDLAKALETLNKELGVERILLEGGGVVNGSFLRVGLIDEVSLLIVPAIDGASGAPTVFDSAESSSDMPAPIQSLSLEKCQLMEGGIVWLRYRLKAA